MDEREVRGLFYERLAKGDGPDEAVASAYLSLGLRVIASVALPQDDTPRYWEAVTKAMGLKTALGRAEMDPGPEGLDPVPIAGRYADAFLAALNAQFELLEYLHGHLEHLPPTPMKAKHDRASLARELVRVRREQEKYFGSAINGGHGMVPRFRFAELDRFANDVLQALLGVMACARFTEAFNAAASILAAEYARQWNQPVGSAN